MWLIVVHEPHWTTFSRPHFLLEMWLNVAHEPHWTTFPVHHMDHESNVAQCGPWTTFFDFFLGAPALWSNMFVSPP